MKEILFLTKKFLFKYVFVIVINTSYKYLYNINGVDSCTVRCKINFDQVKQ